MRPLRVLIVDDDHALVRELEARLLLDGFEVSCAADGHAALEAVRLDEPDLLLLDVALPGRVGPGSQRGIDGIEVLRRVREQGDAPVLMLSATSLGAVKVMALSLGADDYITKPYDLEELVARVHAILRRSHRAGAPHAYVFRRLRLDPEGRRVWKDERPVELTAIEFELLMTLARRPGVVFSRDQLIDQAWRHAYYGVPKVVDVHIMHIRRKIEDDPAHPALITTVRGLGYRFEDQPA